MLSKEKFLEYMNEFKELRDTTDFYNLSLSPEESREFVKIIDLQTKR